jgi:26S proteasome non-ATPase regulatory subunit 10
MSVENIDPILIFRLFDSLKFCSNKPFDACGFRDMELDKMMDFVSKCVCAVIVLARHKDIKDKKDIIVSSFITLQKIVDVGVNLSSETNNAKQLLVQYPFCQKSSMSIISSLHWISTDVREGNVDIKTFNDNVSFFTDCLVTGSRNCLNPGHIIAMNKNPDMVAVEALYEANPRLAYIKDERDCLPLHYAARYSNTVQLIQFIMQRNPDAIKMKDFKGMTPLALACQFNQCIDVCEMLLNADMSMLYTPDNDGFMPFHSACYSGNKAMVSFLLSNAHEVVRATRSSNVIGNKFVLPLHDCARNGNLELFKEVMEAHPAALSHVSGFDGTPLHQATRYGHEAIVRYICAHQINTLSIPNSSNCLPFHCAMMSNGATMSIVKLVYEAYPQAINISTINGCLPIHHLFQQATFRNENDLATNKLRFLLSKCPGCVNLYCLSIFGYETAYSICLTKPIFIQRVVLRARPDMNLQLYRELNYNARRMAVFLGFTAKTEDDSQCLFNRLQIRNFDVFRVIISFL